MPIESCLVGVKRLLISGLAINGINHWDDLLLNKPQLEPQDMIMDIPSRNQFSKRRYRRAYDFQQQITIPRDYRPRVICLHYSNSLWLTYSTATLRLILCTCRSIENARTYSRSRGDDAEDECLSRRRCEFDEYRGKVFAGRGGERRHRPIPMHAAEETSTADATPGAAEFEPPATETTTYRSCHCSLGEQLCRHVAEACQCKFLEFHELETRWRLIIEKC